MYKPLNLIGVKFGYLTVLSQNGKTEQHQLRWLCKCDCGNYTTVTGGRLRFGSTKSCGCLYLKGNRRKHGESSITPEYRAWSKIKERCYSNTSKGFPRWGGRGISMCKEWRDNYEIFLDEMGRRPTNNHSIDRIDNNGNYCKTNCRWATRKEQNNNTTRNRYISNNGVTNTLQGWADKIGVDYRNISYHLNKKTMAEIIEYYNKKSCS